jgi:hypothetical protein
VGASQTNAEFWNGKIDDIRFYNYALSGAQIAWEYNKGGPIAHWKFDECQGTSAYDSSGNGYTGTITPGGAPNTAVGTCTSGNSAHMWADGATGKYNASLGFDGTDDYVNVSDSDSFTFAAGSGFTASTWFKMGTTGVEHDLMCKDTTSNREWCLGIASDNKPYMFVFDQTGNAFIQRNYNTSLASYSGQWISLVGVYDGGTTDSAIKLYLNGVRVDDTNAGGGGGSFSTMRNTSSPLKIGNAYSNYANGQLDDVRIYNYALTATQVKGLYNNGAMYYGPSSGNP